MVIACYYIKDSIFIYLRIEKCNYEINTHRVRIIDTCMQTVLKLVRIAVLSL